MDSFDENFYFNLKINDIYLLPKLLEGTLTLSIEIGYLEDELINCCILNINQLKIYYY